VDQQIGPLRIVDKEPARRGIARKHEGKPIPFEPVANRTIVNMNRRKAFYNDAVVVVDHIRLAVIELVDVYLNAGVRQKSQSGIGVPRKSKSQGWATSAKNRVLPGHFRDFEAFPEFLNTVP